jgi:uncharacterized protein (TIGR00251 family)
MLDIREADGGVTLRVRVQPRAARDELAGERAGALVVRLTAAPVEGEANAALVRFLARRLGRPASAFRLVRGAAARDKVLRVVGLSAAAVRASLEPPAREVGA